MLHELASGYDGHLTLVPIWEGHAPRPQRFAVGDVDAMVTAIMGYDGVPGVNLYAPYSLMSQGLKPNQRGGEKDVLYLLAAVADLDRDKHEQAKIPLEPSYVVESSPGNRQDVYIFPQPLPAKVAKPLLAALHAAIGGDPAQKDLAHVWRVAGTLNWPTKSKLARGRSPIPALVTVAKSLNGVRALAEDVLALKPLIPPKRINGAAKPSTNADVDRAQLAAALAFVPAGDRDTWVKMGMACHTVGARTEWDEWSKTSDKYDAADQERNWRSFNTDRDGLVTPASIFAEAIENGWRNYEDDADADTGDDKDENEEPPPKQIAPAFSDKSLALHFADRHGHDLRYVAKLGRWLSWTETHWQPDDTLHAFDLVRRIIREAATACNKSKKVAVAIASAKTVASVERLAKSDRRIAATIDQWDDRLTIFNTPTKGNEHDHRTDNRHRPPTGSTRLLHQSRRRLTSARRDALPDMDGLSRYRHRRRPRPDRIP